MAPILLLSYRINLKYKNKNYRIRMYRKYALFVVIGAVAAIIFYISSTDFVSAETNCYTSGEKWVCIFTSDDPPAKAVVFCDKDGKNCTVTWLSNEKPPTSDVKNAIENAQVANLAGDLSPDSVVNSAGNTNSTSVENLKEPGKLEFPNLK